MDVPAAFNGLSEQERRYVNQWVSSVNNGGQMMEQLQANSWPSGATGCAQISSSPTGCALSSVGLSCATEGGLRKPEQEPFAWEDGSIFTRGESLPHHSPLGNQIFAQNVRLKATRTLQAARTGEPQDHVLAERKRREKLGQRFMALSAIVPGLKKTDKASVLGDTIKYLKQMQERVKTLEEQANQKIMQSVVLVKKSHLFNNNEISSSDGKYFQKSFNDTLPEIEARISDKNVLVRIHCEKRPAIVEKLLADIGKLHLTITSSNVLSFGIWTLNLTIVAQMDAEFSKTMKDLVMALFACLQ